MFKNKTKTFLLLTLIFTLLVGLSATAAADSDNEVTDTSTIAEDNIEDADINANDVNNRAEIIKNTKENVKGETPEINAADAIITDDSYENFFDEYNTLMEEYNNTDLTVSGAFRENTVFIFDGVNVTLTSDGSAVFYDGQMMTGADAKVVFNGLKFNNSMDAFVLESEANVINNTIINIESEDAIHAIYVYEDGNTIANTRIDVVAPSADVEYNPDYSTKSPAPAAIVISSDNNLIDNVSVTFDGMESSGFFPTVDGIYVVSESTPVVNNTIKDTKIEVSGANYVYGINAGNAKDTTIENVNVGVYSDYYADAIQLFDADTITITGVATAVADSEAYGVYSTAMGYGFSKNIDLTGLVVNVNAPKATGVLIEGASDIKIADAVYSIYGMESAAIKGHVDFMENLAKNIEIKNITADINATQECDAIYFGQSRNITIKDSTITSNIPTYITFNNVTDVKLTDDTITNSTISTLLITNINANGLNMTNSKDAFILESEKNVINNTIINIESEEAIHAIYAYENGNVIANTTIIVSAPSADVEYNPDYSTKSPAPAAIVISSDNNLIDNVKVFFDGRESTGYFPTVDGIYVVSESTPIVNNTIKDAHIIVFGANYAYGINIGNAKDTTIENVDVAVVSEYYADAIQLFDADTITITGVVAVQADSEAYGVYSTAMGYGFSQNIDLTGLDVNVEAPKATGVLIEGASYIKIADAEYNITGDEATAISSYVDWMGNIPTNITITALDISIDTTGDANILYFGKTDDVLITDNVIEANAGSRIYFNSATNGRVTDNYILVGEMLETGIFGNYAVDTTEDDTVVENNTPTSKLVDDLNDKISELEEQLEELNKAKQTTITIDPLEDVKYGDEIEISGLLVNEDSLSISNQPVTITFNGEEIEATTRNGEFKYATAATVVGENTITVNYAGSDKYLESEATYTFEVAKADTIINLTDIEAIKKGETAPISGILYDHNGNALANKVVRLLINNGRKTVKTNDMGEFSFDYTTTKVGEMTLTATFEGNDLYEAVTTETVFEVKALATVITIDPMDTIIKGTQATITGSLTDENGNAIANAQVKVFINGSPKTLKTDSEGRFTHTYTMGKVGENTITATYAGSVNYEAAECETTVEVVKGEAVITLDEIESVTKGENATITGTLTDANGNAIANAQVKVFINGNPKTLKTDSEGRFTHTYAMGKLGENTITATFNGNNDFEAAETNSTVEVIKAE